MSGRGVELFGAHFRNPVLLAAGTCGFGKEVASVIDLGVLGGMVTKSVTLEPRSGLPIPAPTTSAGKSSPGFVIILLEPMFL